MYFKRLEIHGFKSFAEPVVIELHRGITCIVGPNGSGKSNICDAIRWVLGAQSAKMLRGDKMEDVIFAGTASRKSRGMAEVTLVIDNSTGILPIEYNEVAITRRMYRSGESEYLINNNVCRMKDIRELIMDTGIGVEGYSIIGQGKIADIVSNNTESIREILEETAGIVMYRSKKAEAERKLKAARSNVERVNDIIGEIEGRIDGLRQESIKASEYVALRDRYKELEINITLKNVESIELKNEYIKDDITELQQSIEEGKEKKEALSAALAEILTRQEDMDHRIEEARAKHLAAVGEVNGLVSQGEINSERLSAIEIGRNRLLEEIRNLSEKLEREEENAARLLHSREAAERELEARQKILREQTEAYGQRTRTLSEKGSAIEEKKNSIFHLQGKRNALTAEMNSMANLKEALEKRKGSLLDQAAEAQEGKDSRAEALAACREEKEQARIRRDIGRKEKETLHLKQQEDLREEGSLAAAIENIKVEMGQLSARKKTFEEMESNYEGYNSAVKFIMKDKAGEGRDRIEGLHGVVAELITVPRGFETAIETALGATLQNVICRDDRTAKRAIEQLKSNQAGRLTFLPLDTIRSREVKRETGMATFGGFKGYGVDCVSYDKKYRPAMEYLLGNVIVMDNMDNAIALSKRTAGGFRFVTLEGEIINPGGAITGGRHRNRSANILGRKVEIQDLEEVLGIKAREAEDRAAALGALRKTLEERREHMIALDGEAGEAERIFLSKESEISMLETALSDWENSRSKRDQELEQIHREQQTSDKTVAGLRAEADRLGAAIGEMEETIEREARDYEAESLAVARFHEEMTEARIAVGAGENEKNKIDAIALKVEEAIEALQGEKKNREAELQLQAVEKETILAGGRDNAVRVKEKEREREHLSAYLEELAEEREQCLTSFGEDSRAKDEVEIAIHALQSQKYELEIKQARQETQLENAKARLWEEFELSYVQAMDFKKKDLVLSAAIKENREIKSRMRELGEVHIGAIEEYATVSERYNFLTGQREDLVTSMGELHKLIADMDKTIRKRFKDSFDQVVEHFEAVFQELYGGGHARIFLSDEDNPFDSEIEITAQPPGKQLKHINLLSGGEKTMTAIALMFAVLKTKPTPCCILDEVEAALDDSNLNIFGRYLRRFEGVQFTLITHQKATMEHADVMYGITMPESGISKVYSLRMGEEPRM